MESVGELDICTLCIYEPSDWGYESFALPNQNFSVVAISKLLTIGLFDEFVEELIFNISVPCI